MATTQAKADTIFQQTPLLQQFRDFYAKNYPDNLEEALEYFTIFGGMDIELDTDLPLIECIEKLILDHYGEYYNAIIDYTLDDRLNNSLLSAIARGDRRTHSAFKRAHISEHSGEEALNYLCRTGIIIRESSREKELTRDYPSQKLKKEIERHKISDKFAFSSPFLRFWFAFVVVLQRSIELGDYAQFKARFSQHRQGFNSLTFEQLSIELLKNISEEDPIVEIGSYWDRVVEIDIYAKTASGKFIAGECKYTNTKINHSEFTRLKEKCELADLKIDTFVLFSKRGFSNELLAHKEEDLKLYTLNAFTALL